MRTARTGDALAAVVAATGCTGVRETLLQLRPRSRETSNPSSVAAYQASRLKAMSFTLAWNGTVDFVTVGAGEFAGVFEVGVDIFLTVAVRRVGAGLDFSITWFTVIQELFDAS